jgi:hypothetical protein
VTGVKAQRGRVKLCSVDVTLDARPSRLHVGPLPQGPQLKLAGFAIRDSFAGRRATRFWIDRTSGGTLRHSAMLAERDSVVVQGRSVRVYRRDEMRYERKTADAFDVTRIKFDGGQRTLITLQEGAFGYIALPSGRLTAAAGPTAGGDGIFALNWCGDAVSVQFGGGGTEKLDALYEPISIGLVGGNPQGFETHGGEDLWIIENGKAVPAGTATHPAGSRLVIGPLIVDVIGGGA